MPLSSTSESPMTASSFGCVSGSRQIAGARQEPSSQWWSGPSDAQSASLRQMTSHIIATAEYGQSVSWSGTGPHSAAAAYCSQLAVSVQAFVHTPHTQSNPSSQVSLHRERK